MERQYSMAKTKKGWLLWKKEKKIQTIETYRS